MGLWTEARDAGGPFRGPGRGPEFLDALDHVADVTRARFALADDETVLVNEVDGTLPGFPPRETHVVFRTRDGALHRFRVFKRAQEVSEADIPPAWLKAALANVDGFGCNCC